MPVLPNGEITLPSVPTTLSLRTPTSSTAVPLYTDRQLTPHRGTAEDIAAAVVALAGNPAITGALLDVDGGERLGRYSG